MPEGSSSGWLGDPSTLYRENDPDRAGTTYHAGDVWIEHPGVVHEARNEGAVGAIVN